MRAHLRKLDGIPPEIDELAAEAVEDAAEGAPLLANFSSESLNEEEEIHSIRRDGQRSLSPSV